MDIYDFFSYDTIRQTRFFLWVWIWLPLGFYIHFKLGERWGDLPLFNKPKVKYFSTFIGWTLTILTFFIFPPIASYLILRVLRWILL